MAHPYAMIRLVFHGKIEGIQNWSTGVSVLASVAPAEADLAALAANAASAGVSWWNGTGGTGGVSGLNTPDTSFLGVTAYYYPANVNAALVVAEGPVTVHPGTVNNNSLPTQTALVVSTLTGFAGRSNRGRMYLPMTGIDLTAHELTQTQCDVQASITAGLLGAIQGIAIGAGTGNVVVAGKNVARQITAVKVDSEPDIQRRRADKIGAHFSSIVQLAA